MSGGIDHHRLPASIAAVRPAALSRMTTGIYKRERHVAITAVGSGHDQVEGELQRLGIQRPVCARRRNVKWEEHARDTATVRA